MPGTTAPGGNVDFHAADLRKAKMMGCQLHQAAKYVHRKNWGKNGGGSVCFFGGRGKKQKQEKKHGILKLDDCKRRCFLFKPIIFNGPALSFFFGGGGGSTLGPGS